MFAATDAGNAVATVAVPVVVVTALDRTTGFPTVVFHVVVVAGFLTAVATMIEIIPVVVVVVIVVVMVVVVTAGVVGVAMIRAVLDSVIIIARSGVAVTVTVIHAIPTTGERRWPFAVYVREATA